MDKLIDKVVEDFKNFEKLMLQKTKETIFNHAHEIHIASEWYNFFINDIYKITEEGYNRLLKLDNIIIGLAEYSLDIDSLGFCNEKFKGYLDYFLNDLED